MQYNSTECSARLSLVFPLNVVIKPFSAEGELHYVESALADQNPENYGMSHEQAREFLSTCYRKQAGLLEVLNDMPEVMNRFLLSLAMDQVLGYSIMGTAPKSEPLEEVLRPAIEKMGAESHFYRDPAVGPFFSEMIDELAGSIEVMCGQVDLGQERRRENAPEDCSIH